MLPLLEWKLLHLCSETRAFLRRAIVPLASVLAVCHRGGRGRRLKLITMKVVPVVPVADLEEYEKARFDQWSYGIDWTASSFEAARSVAYCLGKVAWECCDKDRSARTSAVIQSFLPPKGRRGQFQSISPLSQHPSSEMRPNIKSKFPFVLCSKLSCDRFLSTVPKITPVG